MYSLGLLGSAASFFLRELNKNHFVEKKIIIKHLYE